MGKNKEDPRMQGFEKLIEDLDKGAQATDPLPATEIRKVQKIEEEKLKMELETKRSLKKQTTKTKPDRQSTLHVPGSGDS